MKSRSLTWKIVGAVAVLLLAWVVLEIIAGSRRLNQLRRDLSAQGEALHWREIVADIPPGVSNGEQYFLEGINGLKGIVPRNLLEDRFAIAGEKIALVRYGTIPTEVYDSRAVGSKQRWVTNLWEELEGIVRSGQMNWRQIEIAATNDVISLKLDWDKGYYLPQPHLAGQRSLFEWLHAAVIWDLHNDDRGAALDKVVTGCRLLKIYDEPGLISALVRIACARRCSQAVWELLQAEGWTDAELARLQRAVDSVRFVESMERALQMERCLAIRSWEQLLRDPQVAHDFGLGLSSAGFDSWSGIIPFWRTFVSSRDLAWYLENYQAQLKKGRASVASKSLLAHTKAFSAAEPEPRKYYLVSRVLTGSMESEIKRALMDENHRELTLAAIALRRYHIRHGTYPENLRQLIPDFLAAVPVDWMNGGELQYERTSNKRFRLWSVGTDGIDNGGDPSGGGFPSGIVEEGKDWVWPWMADPTNVQTFIKDREAEMQP